MGDVAASSARAGVVVPDDPTTMALRVPHGGDVPPTTTRARSTRSRIAPHWLAIVVLLVALALTVAAVIGSAASDRENESRLLKLQVRQVAAALDSAVSSIQEPLAAADQLASSGASTAAFRSFVASEVGPKARFRTISLWQTVAGGAPRLVTLVGPAPEITQSASYERSFFDRMHPSPTLFVTKLLTTPARAIGYGEMAPGASTTMFVFAETNLPASTYVPNPKNSAFSDLDFVLYLGRRDVRSALIENTVHLPISGTTASATVPFGDTVVLIISTPTGPLAGSLPSELPWILAVAGAVIAVAAAAMTERLVRRTEVAEDLAVDNARLYGAQRGIAETLQRALLPAGHPTFPGVELAVRYVPGVAGLNIGGDWYDVITIDASRFFFVVGDVSGRGLKAAATMAYLQHAIRAYATQGDAPDAVLSKLDDLIGIERDESFATVLCGLVDVPARTVTISSAGHPPLLLIDDDGPRFVEVPIATPVGVSPSRPPRSRTIIVDTGTSLIAFTDGLIERRGQPLSTGLESLRRAASGHRGPVNDLLSTVLATLVPHGSEDDIAVLGVRWLR